VKLQTVTSGCSCVTAPAQNLKVREARNPLGFAFSSRSRHGNSRRRRLSQRDHIEKRTGPGFKSLQPAFRLGLWYFRQTRWLLNATYALPVGHGKRFLVVWRDWGCGVRRLDGELDRDVARRPSVFAAAQLEPVEQWGLAKSERPNHLLLCFQCSVSTTGRKSRYISPQIGSRGLAGDSPERYWRIAFRRCR